MRLRSEVVGALNLFTAQAQDLDAETLQLRRALADVATNGLPQARTILQRDALTEQSQSVLDTRVLIQHAKGVIAERHHIDMDAAFTLARCQRRPATTADWRTSPALWSKAPRRCSGRYAVAASATR